MEDLEDKYANTINELKALEKSRIYIWSVNGDHSNQLFRLSWWIGRSWHIPFSIIFCINFFSSFSHKWMTNIDFLIVFRYLFAVFLLAVRYIRHSDDKLLFLTFEINIYVEMVFIGDENKDQHERLHYRWIKKRK